MPKIIIQQDELLTCQILGRMRSIIARGAGIKDAKVGNQDGADADVMGIIAEYAFAKHFNTFPDIGLTPRSGSCDGVLKGYRYDIKATGYKTGKLLCTLKENLDIDMYVLAIVDGMSVDFIGYALSKHLRKEENLTDLGHGKGYALTQDKLTRFQ